MHGVKKSGVLLGQTYTVCGAGAIDLLDAILTRRASGSRVFVSDINPFRLEKALKFSATDVINILTADPVETIIIKTAQKGVDHSYEGMGLETTLLQAWS